MWLFCSLLHTSMGLHYCALCLSVVVKLWKQIRKNPLGYTSDSKKYSEDAQIQRETQEREVWKDLAALREPQTENL